MGEDPASAPAPVQLDAPVPMNSGVAAPAQAGMCWVDDTSGEITWTGTWNSQNSMNVLGGSYNSSTTLNSTASVEFTGTQISLIFAKAPGRGSVEVRIYGDLVTTISMNGSTAQWQQRWDSPLLSEGNDTIILRHPGGSHYVDVDAIIVSETESISPATITDLAAVSGSAHGSVQLNCTAPGDDGTTGTASSFIVRYSSDPIASQGDWDAAVDVNGEPNPVETRGSQSMVISSLVSGNTYYFGIRTKDNVPNTFDISNSPSAAANVPDPVGAGTYDDTSGSIAFVAGWQTQAAGSAYSSTIRFTNSPAVAAYFSFTGT